MKPFISAVLGFLGLLLFYFLVMGLLSRSVAETLEQFGQLWPWILALSAGFGIQVGLYTRMRELVKNDTSQNKGVVAATGSTSSFGMLACCAHHLVEVLPIIGLSAFSVLLIRYQTPILVGSLAINVLGIILMLRNLKMVSGSKNGRLCRQSPLFPVSNYEKL